MSGGTFTDGETGQTYSVDPYTGKLTPIQDTKKKPGLSDLKNKVGQVGTDLALKQGGQAVMNAASGGLGIPGLEDGTPLVGGQVASIPGLEYGAQLVGGQIPGVSPSGWAMSGIGGAGNFIAPAAGAAGLADLAMHRQRIGTGAGYLEGAASGAAIGSYFGPVGMGVGAGVGLLGNALGIGHKSRTHVEEDARQQLADNGIVVPNSDVKEWENNEKFRQSRNESDLTGKDIIHSADLYGIQGYSGLDAAKQEEIANEALKEGLVREHHGTMSIGHSATLDDLINKDVGTGGTGGGGGGGPSKQAVAEAKRGRRRAALAQLMPQLDQPTELAPRYDINVSPLIKNPYL